MALQILVSTLKPPRFPQAAARGRSVLGAAAGMRCGGKRCGDPLAARAACCLLLSELGQGRTCYVLE